jgi:hypothetical protein
MLRDSKPLPGFSPADRCSLPCQGEGWGGGLPLSWFNYSGSSAAGRFAGSRPGGRVTFLAQESHQRTCPVFLAAQKDARFPALLTPSGAFSTGLLPREKGLPSLAAPRRWRAVNPDCFPLLGSSDGEVSQRHAARIRTKQNLSFRRKPESICLSKQLQCGFRLSPK